MPFPIRDTPSIPSVSPALSSSDPSDPYEYKPEIESQKAHEAASGLQQMQQTVRVCVPLESRLPVSEDRFPIRYKECVEGGGNFGEKRVASISFAGDLGKELIPLSAESGVEVSIHGKEGKIEFSGHSAKELDNILPDGSLNFDQFIVVERKGNTLQIYPRKI